LKLSLSLAFVAVSALALAGCNSALTSAISGAATAATPTLCAQYTKTEAQDQLCLSASGVAISVGQAIANGEIK
jgi:hypothetical protein